MSRAVPPWEAAAVPLPRKLESAAPLATSTPASPSRLSPQASSSHDDDCGCAACDTQRTFHSLLRGGDSAAAGSKRIGRKQDTMKRQPKMQQPGWDSSEGAPLAEELDRTVRPQLRLMKWKGDPPDIPEDREGQRQQRPSGRVRAQQPLPEWNSDISSPLEAEPADVPNRAAMPPRSRIPATGTQRTEPPDANRNGNGRRSASVDNRSASSAARPHLTTQEQAPSSAPSRVGPRRPLQSRSQAEWCSEVEPDPGLFGADDSKPSARPRAGVDAVHKPGTPGQAVRPARKAPVRDDPSSGREPEPPKELEKPEVQPGCPKCGRAASGRALVMHLKTCTARQRPQGDPFSNTPKGPDAAGGVRNAARVISQGSRPISPPLPAQTAAARPASPPLPAQAAKATNDNNNRPPSPPLPARAAISVSNTPKQVPGRGSVSPSFAQEQALGPDDDGDSEPLEPCPHCARTFRSKVLQRHMGICVKIFQKQRKTFDAVAHGVSDEAKKAKVSHEGQEKQQAKTSMAAAPAPDAGGDPGWKKKSEAFRSAIKNARVVDQYIAAGKSLKDLPPAPPTDPSLDDRMQCPHCGRRFGQTQAERHIPQCALKNKRPGKR
ncbi:unnamed protein product [Polarella glacialis]|uniref:C2HC/C3H-type domain-containing protein n=1 Tax=Polarella glacialis TaxID=89957 RepID=A0A813FS33_POLGL|nr:unnamed protein product [Polarella glacialis]